MRRNPRMRHLVAWILAVCLLLTCVPAVLAASQTQELGLQEVPVTAEGLTDAPAPQEPDTPGEEESLRVIIIFQDAALVERGYSTMGLASNQGAMAYRATLEKRQDAAMAKVSKALGQELELRYRFSIGVNGVATTLLASQIDTVEALDSVRAVYIENQYLPDTEEPDTSTAGTMVGSYSAWADGYTGAGSRIAIIDTGLDTDHQSMDNGAYLHALEENAKAAEMSTEDYMASLNLLDEEEIASVLPQLNISRGWLDYKGDPKPGQEVTAQELHLSDKIAFAYNYIDQDLDVTHDNDSQGGHGSHVAGIATANRFIPQEEGYVPALESALVVGTAPDAQILVMKVFGKGGGSFDSDYIPNTLTSIPGIGTVYSAGIIAEVGDIRRFASQASVAKYAGLVWTQHQSGEFEAQNTRMIKSGNRYLRYYLLEAANSVRRCDPEFRRYYDLKYYEVNKFQHKRALAFTARKLVRVVFRLLKDNRLYIVPES